MQTRQRVALLRESELFEQLDDEALLKLADRTGYQVFDKRETIFVQGEPGERFFIIADGAVKLLVRHRSGESIELVRLTRPMFLGELAVLDRGVRTASAEAVERTVLLSLTRDLLFEILRSEPLVVEALLCRLAGIVRRTTQDLAALAFLDLEGRVARRILAMSHAPGAIVVGRAVGKSRRITQTEIAHMVSGTRQAVNRALRSLERCGFIKLTEAGVEIQNWDGLRQRAEE
jgi:CRP/FNR family transcriptional regulator, cyclic AMP receptor protein